MKFALDVGHGMHNRVKGRYDPGASVAGAGDEHTYMTGLAARLKEDLTKLGHRVIVLEDMPLTVRDDKAKEWGADFLLSLHLNAGGGSGTETWCNTMFDYRSRKVAGRLRYYLNRMGFPDRGLKFSDRLAVLRANRRDCLLEVCFVDSPGNVDMKRYQRNDAEDVELAVLNGLLTGCGMKSVSSLPRKG